jgi:hypothetical protein
MMKVPIGLSVLSALALLAAVTGVSATQSAPARQASTQRVIVPHESWNCGMPGGIPSPEAGTLVFTAEMPLERVADVGKTQYGRRQVAVAREGTLTGAKLAGTVMTGALDFELTLENGVVEVELVMVVKTADGKYVFARSAGTGPDAKDVRAAMDFEAPNASDAAWLNTGTFVARRVLDTATKTLTVRVYDVSAVKPATIPADAIRITKPAGVPTQPWDYRRAAVGEKQGAQLITERVTLSPSQSVGASKRGNRNIIPITGGELSGRITGKVLPGGADYQNLSNPATIDAHYLWQTTDGEVIVVRNGGTFGSLVPTFEVRVGSQYEWLNSGLYLSSNPGPSTGGVALTFFESTR